MKSITPFGEVIPVILTALTGTFGSKVSSGGLILFCSSPKTGDNDPFDKPIFTDPRAG